MVLVDTSVWIDFLRNPRSRTGPAVKQMLKSDEAVIVDPTVTELLMGARGKRDRQVIIDLACGVQRLRLLTDTWIAAGDIGRAWRKKGRTLSLVDCLLVAACRQHSVALWTLDKDFLPLARAGEIQLHDPG